jgi:hypothetical protein
VKRRFERGQALLELSIALPLMLTGCFFVIWAAQESVLQERVALAARSAATIGAFDDVIPSASVEELYSNLNTASPASPSCSPAALGANENALVGGYFTGGATGVSLNSDPVPGFWRPQSSQVLSCGPIDGATSANNVTLVQFGFTASATPVAFIPLPGAAVSVSTQAFQPVDVASAAQSLNRFSGTVKQSLCAGGGLDGAC